MKVLTPELIAHSYGGVTNTLVSTELDFDLGRRMGIILNAVDGFIEYQTTADTRGYMPSHQELDLDPDNTDILGGHPAVATEAFDRDSTRIFVQKAMCEMEVDNANGNAHCFVAGERHHMDWYGLPMNERPLTINNMRHHAEVSGAATDSIIFWLTIRYLLVELSDQEIGLTAILRR